MYLTNTTFKIIIKVVLNKFYIISIVMLSFSSILLLYINSKNDNFVKVKIKYDYPLILWWTKSFPGTSQTRVCDSGIRCDITSDKVMNSKYYVQAYLFYGSDINFNDLPLPRRPEQIIWGLFHEESPRNTPELMHEKVLSLFNFSSTFSRHSNVPFPLQYLENINHINSTKYFVKTELKNSYLDKLSPIMFLQSDCDTSTERDAYVKELMKLIKIDSYGACLKNKKLPKRFTLDYLNNLDDRKFLNFIARYKFVISIENGMCEDYVTEKFWRAIKVGTVPIYFGSPSIMDWLPNNKSAILLEEFPTPQILHRHLIRLLNNDTLYEEYLKHKTERLITNERIIHELKSRPYQKDSLESVKEFECFICKKLHERMKGNLDINIVDKSHYYCPIPLSALTLQVNARNDWVYTWNMSKKYADKIYKKIMSHR